jgi:hypothetical protein
VENSLITHLLENELVGCAMLVCASSECQVVREVDGLVYTVGEVDLVRYEKHIHGPG